MFIYFWGNILALNCILFQKKPLCWSLTFTKIKKVGRQSPINLHHVSAEWMSKLQLRLGLPPCSSVLDAALFPRGLCKPHPARSWKSKSLPHFPVVCTVDHHLHPPIFSSLSFYDSALSWLVSFLLNCFLLPDARIKGNLTKISSWPIFPHSIFMYLIMCSY